MEFSLRSVRADEIDWLYQLKKDSYRDVVISQFGCWDEAKQRKMFFDKWRSMHPAKIIIVGAEKTGAIVIEQRKYYDWLGDIQIMVEYREQGLGTSVIQLCVRQAQARERPLRLQVLHQNHRANLLYKRLGFVQIELLENHYLLEIE